MNTRSIRFRMTASYSLLSATTLTIFGVALYQFLSIIFFNYVDADLRKQAEVIKRFIRIEDDQIRLEYDKNNPEEATMADSYTDYMRVIDRYGRVINQSTGLVMMGDEFRADHLPDRLQAPRTGFRTVTARNHEKIRFIETVIYDSSHIPYLLQIGFPLRPTEQALRGFMWAGIVLIPVTVAIAFTGGWLMANRMLKPVSHITQTAQQISASNLALRIPVRGINDELDQLAATFNDMIARLESGFERIRQFSSNVSHELRTPLTIIQGETEVALMSDGANADFRRVLESNLEEIDRMSHMINDLLTLARADAGELDLNLQPLELESFLTDLLSQVQLIALEKEISITLDSSGPITTRGDALQIRRVMLNLIDNALKYTPPFGKIRIALSSDERWGRISLLDTGRGIPYESLPYIFDRFYRVDQSRSREVAGTGLGLSIVKSIVDAHGGRIDVKSRLGIGTEFILRFPLEKTAEETSPVSF
ncbi:MAG: heavy metal sensor histidine kinase [Acidobacteria bacterium]|nr:heavy metal sensor histidine kinase [Acidobacteriota bacterium]MBI3656493.1 heavy metal sensor histidine kinase [Acidobacteriota bacterium]